MYEAAKSFTLRLKNQNMFKISFRYLDKSYTAKVEKVNGKPVRFVVTGITPYLQIVPLQLTYESRKEDDALIYRFFSNSQVDVLTLIGETIFKACQTQRTDVHK